MLFFLPSLAQLVNNLPVVQETGVRSLGWEDLLEKEMANLYSILAWKISWTEEPGGLQSMGSKELGTTDTFTFSLYLGKNPWTQEKDSKLPLQGVRVQSLVREVPNAGQCSQKEKKTQKPYSLLILTSS